MSAPEAAQPYAATGTSMTLLRTPTETLSTLSWAFLASTLHRIRRGEGALLAVNLSLIAAAGTTAARAAAQALVSTLAGNLTPVASVANLIVLELAGNEGKIPFRRFVLVGAGATFLPLFLGLATLLAERRWGLFDAYVK